MNFRIRKSCRLCNSVDLELILELENTPLANDFVKEGDLNKKQELFPLYLVRCNSCNHVQLPVIVDPDRLFSNYVYVSGTSKNFVEHFKNYSESIIKTYNLKPNDLVVEIGSNDGTLLNFFKEAGMRVVGIDPAKKISKTANDLGINTICSFFDKKISEKIKTEYGTAKIVLANNVFAHADDLQGIVAATKSLLDPVCGSFIFEVQYLLDLVKNNLFDMVYHEHLSYHSMGPLVTFFNQFHMQIQNVERINTHGGSIRVHVSVNPVILDKNNSLIKLLEVEQNSLNLKIYKQFKKRIDDASSELNLLLSKKKGKIIGYGAPAKLTTLMYQFKLDSTKIEYIVDDNPLKQDLYSPGLHIPIKSSEYLKDIKNKPEHIVVFAWNFADSITSNLPEFAGKFIIPLPNLKEL
jgi:SAM-dependent methyltransferase